MELDKVLGRIGRRARATVPYLLPPHETEVDRLDLQHYAIRETIGGNYVAPIEDPRRILDVGTGTGQWAFDLCDEFPEAMVVGFDLAPSKPSAPSNYQLVRGNLFHGLPFTTGSFDFVHQRFMSTAIPAASWPATVVELTRVTRPGGLVELAEAQQNQWAPGGPPAERLVQLFDRLAADSGLDATGTVFASLDGYLRNAGLVDVERHEIGLPVGDWGGKVGTFMASAVRNLLRRMAPIVEERLGVPATEYLELLQAAIQDFERYRPLARFAVAHGRKPTGSPRDA
jgi:SAM-dependent methyltransferase